MTLVGARGGDTERVIIREKQLIDPQTLRQHFPSEVLVATQTLGPFEIIIKNYARRSSVE